MNILIYDIETSPNLAYVWGKWQQDVIAYEKEWDMLSFSHKWLGERKVHVHSQRDMTEKKLVKELWCLFDDADIIIAHNGDNFDQKKSNSKFLEYDHTPPSHYKTIDTLKIARKYFKFNSNRLNDLALHLGIGEKMKHTGFALWQGCMRGDDRAWATMERYNKKDVKLLEDVYLRLRPWIENHPATVDFGDGCPTCGHKKLLRNGHRYNTARTRRYQSFLCLGCGARPKSGTCDKTYKVGGL